MELLAANDGLYSNSDTAASFLVDGSPMYQGRYIEYVSGILKNWTRLEERVRLGSALRAAKGAIVGQDVAKTRDFMTAMHANALPNANALLSAADFGACKRIFDVGCGPGTYSIAIATKHTSVQCDLLDLPTVTGVAKEHVQTAGLTARVHVSAGDYLNKDEFPTGYDAVLLLAVIHQESASAIEALLKKAAHSLNPGGADSQHISPRRQSHRSHLQRNVRARDVGADSRWTGMHDGRSHKPITPIRLRRN
jgi:3-hydroxy-5-methyl-1-naphthoate 3-O-methyltransferase